MARKICNHCQETVRSGEAVIRSIGFQQVAWHKDCYLVRDITPAELVAAS